MPLKITVNKTEVQNPLAKIILALIGATIAIAGFLFVIFMIFPFVWFMAIGMFMLVMIIILVNPRVGIAKYILFLDNKQK